MYNEERERLVGSRAVTYVTGSLAVSRAYSPLAPAGAILTTQLYVPDVASVPPRSHIGDKVASPPVTFGGEADVMT